MTFYPAQKSLHTREETGDLSGAESLLPIRNGRVLEVWPSGGKWKSKLYTEWPRIRNDDRCHCELFLIMLKKSLKWIRNVIGDI